MADTIPQLTLTPDLQPETPESQAVQAPAAEQAILSPAEQQAVDQFAAQIDLHNSQQILTYGAAAQKNIADFSQGALETVRTKDMGQVGEMLSELVAQLSSIEPEEKKKGLAGLFQRAGDSMEKLKVQYSKAETNVDRITEALEKHQLTLMKDIAVLDQMYEKNLQYFKELTMYILAGQQKVKAEREGELARLRSAAAQSGRPEDAQAANDYAALIDRFEKKLHDLELTRIVSLQMGPQIRMVQNNDTLMTEKIQTSLVNTIPLWKSQMVLSLGIHHAQQAMEAQRQVTDMTNRLLKTNADMLKMASVETAKESERAVVDLETLQHTNQTLIETLDEVLQIQQEGRQKRQQASAELKRMEDELRNKLLELRR
ncbi:MAG TPA: toxic anion resistance protein [Candidatus Avoscillospira stercorigallinarum]|uniref:Toxic anion resistance protein n=1 Tax=Candidatus Avoscillospira stercorigallinarum TaxID=2840708 RepID=A0A9D0Z5Q2_9FIRM|nr:toxic anion resistance protein [Candidatus Avoscillospira stercorigallinarum]